MIVDLQSELSDDALRDRMVIALLPATWTSEISLQATLPETERYTKEMARLAQIAPELATKQDIDAAEGLTKLMEMMVHSIDQRAIAHAIRLAGAAVKELRGGQGDG